MGVLGGRRLLKTSGERAGPNDTLLHDRRFEVGSATNHQGPAVEEAAATAKGDVASDSSSSWMDIRDTDMEEDIRERESRPWGRVGVSVFLAFTEEEAGVVSALACGVVCTIGIHV